MFHAFFVWLANFLNAWKLPTSIVAVVVFYMGFDALYNQMHSLAMTHLNTLPPFTLRFLKEFGFANYLNMVFAAYAVRVSLKTFGSLMYDNNKT